jgi:hypothetical protein
VAKSPDEKQGCHHEEREHIRVAVMFHDLFEVSVKIEPLIFADDRSFLDRPAYG